MQLLVYFLTDSIHFNERYKQKSTVQLLDYTLLFYSILYYTLLSYTIVDCTVLYYTILSCKFSLGSHAGVITTQVGFACKLSDGRLGSRSAHSHSLQFSWLTMSDKQKRTDPSDEMAYTFPVLATFYLKQGWPMELIEEYWKNLDVWQPSELEKTTIRHKMYRKDGRTRTKKKEVLLDDHPLVKKRKKDTANGSKWETW